MEEVSGLVLVADVVGSRRDAAATAEWLRALADELDDAFADERTAPFGFTQGDELQGLLKPEADPFGVILRAALHADARPMRWAVIRGGVHKGRGPATHRTGSAFVTARREIEAARTTHERLAILTGDESTDSLLSDLTPSLIDILDGLTPRQRTIARMALVGELRQSEIAERLGIRRATVSVSMGRAHVETLRRLVAGIRSVYNGADSSDRPNGADPRKQDVAR